MAKKKVSAGIFRMPDAELITSAAPVVEGFKNNPVPELLPWPSFVPPADRVVGHFERYRQAHSASLGRDPAKISEKNACREAFANDFVYVLDYHDLAARNDPTILSRAGLQHFLSPGASNSKGPLTYPGNLTLKYAPESGVLIAGATSVPGARGYEVFITEGDPTVESNWSCHSGHSGCSKMELRGLWPGKRIWVKARAKAKGVAGPFCPAVSIIVV